MSSSSSSSSATLPLVPPPEDDDTFLARMNAKQLDPAKPDFTYEEVARCWRIVTGDLVEGNERVIREYCVRRFNAERNELRFYN